MYLGHGKNTGGLQRHSIGSLYPWIIVGYQRTPDSAVEFYGENANTGKKTKHYATAAQAVEAVRCEAFRSSVLEAIAKSTGHKLPK